MRARTLTVAVTAALATIAVAASSAPVTAATGCPAPVAVAHRGESDQAPEETAPAIVSALRGGARVIEMDVRWTRSTVAVLMHDATVDRTTNGTGPVSGFWLWQIRQLDAGSWFSGAYVNARVLTLGEALRLIRPTPGVVALPELKGTLTDTQLRIVAKAITDNGMGGRVVVHASSATVLQRFHAVAPTVPLGLVTSSTLPDPVAAVRDARATYWLPEVSTLTPEALTAAHTAGIKVWPWAVDTLAGWDRLAGLGADGVLTNKAARYQGWALAKCGGA